MREEMERAVRNRTQRVVSRLVVWLQPGGGIPAQGEFDPRKAYVIDLEDGNPVWFYLDCDPEGEDSAQRRLTVGTSRKGTDQEISYYITMGTNEELIDFLSDEECIDSCARSFLELSELMDKKYGPAPKPEPEVKKETKPEPQQKEQTAPKQKAKTPPKKKQPKLAAGRSANTGKATKKKSLLDLLLAPVGFIVGVISLLASMALYLLPVFILVIIFVLLGW